MVRIRVGVIVRVEVGVCVAVEEGRKVQVGRGVRVLVLVTEGVGLVISVGVFSNIMLVLVGLMVG